MGGREGKGEGREGEGEEEEKGEGETDTGEVWRIPFCQKCLGPKHMCDLKRLLSSGVTPKAGALRGVSGLGFPRWLQEKLLEALGGPSSYGSPWGAYFSSM